MLLAKRTLASAQRRYWSSSIVATATPSSVDEAVGCILGMLRDDDQAGLDDYARRYPIRDSRVVAAVIQRAGDSELATHFFRWVSSDVAGGFNHTSFTYNRLIEVLIRAGRHRDAYRLLKQEMSSSSSSSCSPSSAPLFDSYTYFLLVRAFCNARELAGASELLIEMRRNGLIPGTNLYNSLVSAFCKEGKLQEAVKIFDSMVSSSDGSSMCKPDVVTFNTLISGLCKAGRIEEAKRILVTMGKAGYTPNVVTYNSIISGMCNAGMVDEAELILRGLMLRKGLSPDAVTYNSLIHGFCRTKQIEKAYSVLREMSATGCSPDTASYTTIVAGLVKSGKVKTAASLVAEMVASGCSPSVVTYNSLLQGLCKAGEVKAARELWMAMGTCHDAVSYATMVDGLCKAGDVNGAMALVNEMAPRRVADVAVYGALVHGLCRSGRLEDACKTVEAMVAAGYCCPASFAAVVDGLCRAGRPGRAKALLGAVQEKGLASHALAFDAVLGGVEDRTVDRAGFERWKSRASRLRVAVPSPPPPR